jgi:drug/metabolite transporter (DMT)-like permease
MNTKIWRILVTLVVLIFLTSYFVFFQNHQTEPSFIGFPYILWTGILLTILLVICTFIGAKFSPFKNSDKS